MKYLSITCAGVLALVAVALAGAAAEPKADRTALVAGNNDFAFDLYGKLAAQEGNLFLSPYSISTALGLADAGARGATAEEMAKALHFTLEPQRLNAAFGDLQKELNGDSKNRRFQLNVANALWGQKGYGFLPEYVQLARDDYGAAVKEVDFQGNAEKARQTINGWVEEQTQDKIKELLQPGVIMPDTRLVLTNAIYFKAAWLHPFNEKQTKKEDFRLPGDKKAGDVPLMHQNEDYAYYEDDALQMVTLPYEGGELSMVVLLPKKVDGLPDLEKSLSAAKLAEWQGKAKTYDVDLILPKFKVTAEFGLKPALEGLGMKKAFTPGADFSGISKSEKLMISAVIHKAYVDVNEKGTEAAAATAVVFAPTAIPPVRQKATFRADHPFVFAIRHNATGSILFLGRVVNPA
jgi:serine protease inhibitor